MSGPHRSLGPVIAYMLTLLGLMLGGIWLWNALHNPPAPRQLHETQAAPPQAALPQAAPPQAASPPASGEDLSATERRQLEDILRHKPAAGKH